MKSTKAPTLSPKFDYRLLIIVGGYGSGKSEISVNLARFLAQSESQPVSIADLDIVNPYFRSREAADQLAEFGVRSLLPPGDQVHADLPIIIPDIRSAIENPEGYLILDVGGDDVGARALSSLHDAILPLSYDLLFVLNVRRPFTSDLDGSLKTMSEIEASSRLRFTGIISNTHLMADTTQEIILAGLTLAREVAKARSLPISFVSGERNVVAAMYEQLTTVPVLPLDRALIKPWEHLGNTWTDKKLRIR